MEGFDFESFISTHPNVTSLKEIEANKNPTRVACIEDKFAKRFVVVIKIETLEYELFVGIPKKFPEKLPWIFLYHPEQHDFHNHVNYNGEICYTVKSDGLFINVNQPEAIIHQALNQAVQILGTSIDRDLSELYEEFEGYWHSLPNSSKARCFLTPTSQTDQITALCNQKSNKKPVPHTFYKEPLPKHYGYNYKLKGQQSRKAWYLPLEMATLPPNPNSGLTPSYLRSLLNSVSNSQRVKFLKYQEKQKRKARKNARRQSDFLLFSQLRPSGSLALFGIAVTGISRKPFFLSSNDVEWTLTPLSIQKHYQEYLLERGGAQSSLQDKTVAIIGCGAVGSRVSEQLALSGIGKLIILDNDVLSEDNIYRHVLGGDYIDTNKAKAMATHLKERLPYINVVPRTTKSDAWFQKKEWKDVDIIVDATADLTLLRAINKDIVKSSHPVPIVYCWLEPCSIGGHALLVDGISTGCLECLLDCTDQGPFIRCSFLEPYQNVTKDLTGCGGAFTPFSSLDAIKTATLTTELVLEYLLKTKPTSYRFWIGNDDIAEEEKLKTTQWYEKAANQDVAEIEQGFRQKHCLICGDEVNAQDFYSTK